MKSPARRTILLLLPLLLCVGSACSGKKDGDDASKDLKNVAIAMTSYCDDKHKDKKGPSKAEDLAPYLGKDERLLERIRSGDIVVLWDVWLFDLFGEPGGLGGSVIAYEKDAPTKGGLVVMGDRTVKKVSPDEFTTLNLAKPKKK